MGNIQPGRSDFKARAQLLRGAVGPCPAPAAFPGAAELEQRWSSRTSPPGMSHCVPGWLKTLNKAPDRCLLEREEFSHVRLSHSLQPGQGTEGQRGVGSDALLASDVNQWLCDHAINQDRHRRRGKSQSWAEFTAEKEKKKGTT